MVWTKNTILNEQNERNKQKQIHVFGWNKHNATFIHEKQTAICPNEQFHIWTWKHRLPAWKNHIPFGHATNAAPLLWCFHSPLFAKYRAKFQFKSANCTTQLKHPKQWWNWNLKISICRSADKTPAPRARHSNTIDGMRANRAERLVKQDSWFRHEIWQSKCDC